MGIKLGTINISKVYVGNSTIKEVYVGTYKVLSGENIIWQGSATGTVTTTSHVVFGPTVQQLAGATYQITGDYEVLSANGCAIDIRERFQSKRIINISNATTGKTGTFSTSIVSGSASGNTRLRQLFQARYTDGAYSIELTNVKLVKL